jgi:hypothetical protein
LESLTYEKPHNTMSRAINRDVVQGKVRR